jgi:uncharacterized damage-inducible protein DinB
VDQLLETWRIHGRICTYVLDAVDDAALAGAAAKGRSVGEQFAHIHAVRLMWLKAAAPDLLDGLGKLEKDPAPAKVALRDALDASAARIEELLSRGLEAGRIKGFRPHPTAFLGYLISHESYHQGDLGRQLAGMGMPLPKSVAYGMWEWGTR